MRFPSATRREAATQPAAPPPTTMWSPGVNYGIFTNEADAAVVAQAPALAKGGSVDDAIAAIDAQVKQQIQ